MNILISGNNNYSFPTKVFLFSLLKNNPAEYITIYFLYNEFSEENKKDLASVLDKFNHFELKYIYVSPDIFKNAPLSAVTNPYITIETYFRLAMVELLPSEIDRVLYLDTDIIVNGPVGSFYNYKFLTNTIALVCEDFGLKMAPKLHNQVYNSLCLEESHRYFNAGVMLISMKEMRKRFTLSSFICFIKQNKDYLIFHDQDVMNKLFSHSLEYSDYNIYNCRPFFYEYNKKNETIISKNAVFIHYGEKPWNSNFCDMGGSVFWKYALEMGATAEYEKFIYENKKYKRKNRKKVLIRKFKRNIKLFYLRKIRRLC